MGSETGLKKDTSPVKTHQKCPSCGHEECASFFDDGGYYCHSECGYVPAKTPSGSGDKGAPTSKDKVETKVVPYFGFSQKVIEFLDIKTSFVNGEPYARLYPYPHSTKKRILPKDFSDNKGFTTDFLFAMDKWNAGSSRVLTIVEGEDDVPAAIEMIGGNWPVVSLPSASITKGLLQNEKVRTFLNQYDSFAIATDSDAAGERAALILETNFPNKCYRVSMTKHKDAKDYWTNGDQSDFKYAWINRKKLVKPFDTNTPAQFKKLLTDSKDAVYLPTGIAGYDEIGLGLFQGHMTVFTAQEGIGKTELFRMLEYNLIKNHPDVPFAFCHLEEPSHRSLLGLCSYHLKKNVTRKDLITDQAEVDRAIDEMMCRDTVHQFSIGTDEDPDVLVERIKYYANACGCKYVFFEPIQDIAAQRKGGMGLTEYLDQLAIQLSRTAAETGCGIILIAHANESGDTRDSKQIQKQASVRVELKRDLEATDEEERNKTRLFIRKNRPVGPLGAAGELTFDLSSFTLREVSYA